MRTSHLENADGSLTITIDLDAQDVLALKHNLPGIQGIVDWYSKGPSIEKIYHCRKRMISENRMQLINNLVSRSEFNRLKECLENDEECAREISKLDSYKDREELNRLSMEEFESARRIDKSS